MRAARTPPDPPPMTNRSVSNSAMWLPADQRWVSKGYRRAITTKKVRSFLSLPKGRDKKVYGRGEESALTERLAALLHLVAEISHDHFGKGLRPLVHVDHAGLDGLRLLRQHLLAERRLVERREVLQFLLGEIVGVDLRHLLADLLLAAGLRLGFR